MREEYKQQIELLLNVLSISLNDERVALKGGTAINLFHRNFPRYSVDIDLCYLPIEERDQTFHNLHQILSNIKNKIEKNLKYKVQSSVPLNGKKEAKLVVSDGVNEIKIEPNFTLRGCLFAPEIKSLSPNAAKELKREISVKCLSLADTYGGKICAALDRQHPRDLFDVEYLFENEGITEDVKDSFIYYLISHNRPIDELLNPNLKNIDELFTDEFQEMAFEHVTIDELIKNRSRLVEEIKSSLTEKDKKFLISFATCSQDWSLFRDQKIKDYPSVKWKMLNQGKMSQGKKENYIEKVKRCLNIL